MILALAALGFFGLGAQPPTSEWGTRINQNRLYMRTAPTLMIYPGAAISLTVLGFNLLGDGLGDAPDPAYLGRSAPQRICAGRSAAGEVGVTAPPRVSLRCDERRCAATASCPRCTR